MAKQKRKKGEWRSPVFSLHSSPVLGWGDKKLARRRRVRTSHLTAKAWHNSRKTFKSPWQKCAAAKFFFFSFIHAVSFENWKAGAILWRERERENGSNIWSVNPRTTPTVSKFHATWKARNALICATPVRDGLFHNCTIVTEREKH